MLGPLHPAGPISWVPTGVLLAQSTSRGQPLPALSCLLHCPGPCPACWALAWPLLCSHLTRSARPLRRWENFRALKSSLVQNFHLGNQHTIEPVFKGLDFLHKGSHALFFKKTMEDLAHWASISMWLQLAQAKWQWPLQKVPGDQGHSALGLTQPALAAVGIGDVLVGPYSTFPKPLTCPARPPTFV